MNDAAPESLRAVVDAALDPVDTALDAYRPRLRTEEVGTITRLPAGIVEVRGFTDVRDQELVAFDGGLLGFAANLARDHVGVVLLGDGTGLRVGDAARRTRRVLDVPVGEAMLGRIVDALGRPLDGEGTPATTERRPIERAAPAIIARAPVEKPLQTGIKAVDAAIPIGRGQRELIVGDRQTGKTAIALDAMINQDREDVVCVYCAIGQRGSAVARVIAELRARGALDHTIVVVAAGEEAPGLQYAAPYAATSMAEWFTDRGRDVLVVYDDLTRHARAYRELSLLLRRPPGREAYPGDIFYIHSRLLERATHLRDDAGGGSLTALPVIETQAQNISAYIPTNLISITDGQIYLGPDLFRKGQLPAVDVGKSVSRVGGKAQLAGFRAVAGDLRLAYAQFEELETFARFGTRLDEDTKRRLERGRRVREILQQNEHDLLTVPEQITVLLATTQGLFDDVPLDDVRRAEAALRRTIREEKPELRERLAGGRALDDDERTALLDAARDVLAPYRA
jgi:F-type H+-transporting ATPase subunit alpha